MYSIPKGASCHSSLQSWEVQPLCQPSFPKTNYLAWWPSFLIHLKPGIYWHFFHRSDPTQLVGACCVESDRGHSGGVFIPPTEIEASWCHSYVVVSSNSVWKLGPIIGLHLVESNQSWQCIHSSRALGGSCSRPAKRQPIRCVGTPPFRCCFVYLPPGLAAITPDLFWLIRYQSV